MPNISKRRMVKFGCDADLTDMKQFDSTLKINFKQTCCDGRCCIDGPNVNELIQISTSSVQDVNMNTQSESISSIPQDCLFDTDEKLRSTAALTMENFKRTSLDIPPHVVLQ